MGHACHCQGVFTQREGSPTHLSSAPLPSTSNTFSAVRICARVGGFCHPGSLLLMMLYTFRMAISISSGSKRPSLL